VLKLFHFCARLTLAMRIRQIETQILRAWKIRPADPIAAARLTAHRERLSLKLCRLRGHYHVKYDAPGTIQTWDIA
jgi:hypothetical protein